MKSEAKIWREENYSSLLPVEEHFNASDTVSDIVISTPNGLIVPFALAAGLTESKPIKSEIQTVLIGGIGATVTFPLPIFIR